MFSSDLAVCPSPDIGCSRHRSPVGSPKLLTLARSREKKSPGPTALIGSDDLIRLRGLMI